MKISKSYFFQFTGTFLAAISVSVFMMYFVFMIPGTDDAKAVAFIGNLVFIASSLLLILCTPVALTIYSRRRHSTELQQYINISVLRYVIAFLMFFYGFSKMAGKFFEISYLTQDSRLVDIDSFSLTWFYFGKSNVQEFIIGLLEFVPAILLLFRKTTLLGLLLLLPVALNVMMINIFNHISGLTFPVSVLITLVNIYLLYVWKDDLIAFIKKTAYASHPALSRGANILRTTFKIVIVGTIVLFAAEQIIGKILINKHKTFASRNKITGGFGLETISVNGQNIQPEVGNTKFYKAIYLEPQSRWNSILYFTKEFEPHALRVHWYPNSDSITTFIKKQNDVSNNSVDSATMFRGTYKLSGKKLYINGIQYGDTIRAVYYKKDLRDYNWFW